MGAEYPWAFAADGALSAACGVKGIPAAALIDPEGKILWTGSPYALSGKAIKDALKGASRSITFGWGDAFEGVAELVVEGKFGKAVAEADKLAERGEENAATVRTSILAKLAKRTKAMEKAYADGDFLRSLRMASALDGQLGGLEEEGLVRSRIEAIETNEEAKPILEGQEKLARITEGSLEKSKQVQSAIKKAEKLAEKYEGTIVATQAEAFVRRMKARLAAKK